MIDDGALHNLYQAESESTLNLLILPRLEFPIYIINSCYVQTKVRALFTSRAALIAT